MQKNNYFLYTHYPLFSSVLFSILILTNLFSESIFGQVAIPLSKINPKDSEIFRKANRTLIFNNKLIISSTDALWMVDTDGNAQHILNMSNTYSFDLATTNNYLFVRSENYLWAIDGEGRATLIEKIIAPSESITENIYFKTFNDTLFFVSDGKLRTLNKENKPIDIDSVKGKVISLLKTNDSLFVNTDQGPWSLDINGTATKIAGIKGEVKDAKHIDNNLLIATTEGVWRVLDGKKTINMATGSDVISLEVFDNCLAQIKYGLELNDARTLLILDLNTMKGFSGDGYYETTSFNDKLFYIQHEHVAFYSKVCSSCSNLGGFKSDLLEGVKGVGYSIKVYNDQLFVITSEGLWIFSKNNLLPHKIDAIKNHLSDIESDGTHTYIRTLYNTENIFRLDHKVTIKSNLNPIGWWATFINYLLPSNYLPVGKVPINAFYADETGNDPYNEIIPREFRFAQSGEDDTSTSEEIFSAQDQFNYEIHLGKNEVHYWVKDKWGNTFEQRAVYYGIPSQYFFVTIPFFISIIFVLVCFALAPKVKFCHSAIMNPWLRTYFSLGSIPLLLSIFPSLRHYILRRYSDCICKEKEFAEWKERFIYPDREFKPENFGKKLDEERRLLLTGQSGVGKTSFFKHLTAIYASSDRPSLPAKVIPVYISLTNFGGNSLENIIYNQLFAYGKVTDNELAPMFLEQGGLVIFLDGVNEIQNVTDQQKLYEFVEKYRMSSYICLSSQINYLKDENIPEVKLKTFSAEKVCELINRRTNDKETAKKIIRSLTDEDYLLYSIPRDLEFAIAILNSGEESLPKSRTELYKIAFSSIFNKWKEEGNADLEANLYRLAYERLISRESIFDSVDTPKFKEITNDLFKQNFLIQREKNYIFRHDLIRSYLASEYFYSRWQILFENIQGKPVDTNWLEMIKFSCENIKDSKEVKFLVYEVMEKSVRKDLVEDLFEWLQNNHKEKCKMWKKEFYIKYGELTFNRGF